MAASKTTTPQGVPPGVERRLNADGTPNPRYVDLLDEDPAIGGQKFACISFVSPERILKQKEHYFFEQFVRDFDLAKSMEKFRQFLSFVSYKYGLRQEDVMTDFEEFAKEERTNLVNTTVLDDYKTFLDKNEERLEEEFGQAHRFQTSTRGMKVRGVFPTQQEAEVRCRMLREVDPHHDVYVGPVGVWMPWEPEAYKTGRVEYLEEELNQLMHEKEANEHKAKQEFEARVKETKRKAIEENIERARSSGNKLTQQLDDAGNLVGVAGTNTQEEALLARARLAAAESGAGGAGGAAVGAAAAAAGGLEATPVPITGADIQRELFEGNTVRTKKQ